ncbi:MAG: SUF system NifU family Fe-S cluster assembly protein [Deltaproteobacteria bacterium]|nr:SUF system NifU family Fe-S cluster assembly protein [Deltaproteobacteria bacterium]
MTELKQLYQETILDHNRAPRNFGRLEAPGLQRAEGFNPLCGDRLTVYLHLEKELIRSILFEGSGCAISKASASLMTATVKGRSIASTHELFEAFHRLITGAGTEQDGFVLGKLAVFSGVCDFPSRVKCASLPWHTLMAALKAKETPQPVVSTE